MSQGKLIVLEGPDGVGKTELALRLSKLLSSERVRFEYLPFPGRSSGSLGALVYLLHHNPTDVGVAEVTPTALQVLHIAAHLDGLERYILPAQKTGVSFVIDRFWWSTIVYGRTAGVPEAMLSSLLQLEQLGWQGIVPDAVLLISRAHPLRKEPLDTWHQITLAYEHLAKEENGKYPILRIENTASPEIAIETILTALRHLNIVD